MDRKLVGAMLLLLASTGCRMCSSCCDNLPPVLDGPYPHTGGRAGSAFGGVVVSQPFSQSKINIPTSEESAVKEQTEDSTAATEEQDLFAQPFESTDSQALHLADADD